jgi:KipI family sensor histidine kinase inhibitor
MTPDRPPAIEPLGDRALVVRFADRIDAATNARVHAAAERLRALSLAGVVDIVPAYASLTVHYAPAAWAHAGEAAWRRLADQLRAQLGDVADPGDDPARAPIELVVRYGGDDGPDLVPLADALGLEPEDVIARHCEPTYRVAMLGFAPGFAYLLGLDPSLHAPRRAAPRTRVPAGSVAIGGAQTGVYPRELPGGWHLVGRTTRTLFDPARAEPALLAPGDRVRFVAAGAATSAR